MATSTDFIRRLVDLILNETQIVGESGDVLAKNDALIEFKQPADLEKELSVEINGKTYSNDDLLELCRKVIRFSAKTSHPYFYNQLYGGVDEYSLGGAWLTEALNTSQATYEISPVFTIMERECIKFLGSKCVGWPLESVDGIFAPGGSMSNIYGIVLARHRAFPEAKRVGVAALGRLVCFVSEQGHYSFVKGCVWMGHGSEAVIKVRCDDRGRMVPEALRDAVENALKSGAKPFMVACTAGTTVLGAFDPLEPIADICGKYGLWMHVDACLGGGVLLSGRHRTLMAGANRADSVAWNLHKLGGVPLQCSMFVTRHAGLLADANALKAEYLFQADKYYDASYDTGDKSIQCGRKVDSLKLTLALLARGQSGLEKQMDEVMDIATYVTDKIRQTPGFKLVLDEYQLTNICFWYVPSWMRPKADSTGEWSIEKIDKATLHKVAPAIKGLMMTHGRFMVNYQPLTSQKLPNFFRLVLTCVPMASRQEMDNFVNEVASLGEQIKI